MLEKNNIYSTKTIKVKKKNLANPLNTHTRSALRKLRIVVFNMLHKMIRVLV
jgi:16S rRNA G966 N2-methylase RsmD